MRKRLNEISFATQDGNGGLVVNAIRDMEAAAHTLWEAFSDEVKESVAKHLQDDDSVYDFVRDYKKQKQQ